MCTALVVYDEYWARQQRTLAELCGVDNDYVERVKIAIVSAAQKAGEYIREILKQFTDACVVVGKILSETFGSLCDALAKLLDEVGITEADDYFTICDKFENYAIYAERKYSIAREQYYRNCFKLARINYAVRNHDRRC